MNLIARDFASLIKSRRQDQNLSLRALADITGLSFSGIAKLERGDITPTFDNAMRLARALGFSLDAIAMLSGNSAVSEVAIRKGAPDLVAQVDYKFQKIKSGRRKNLSKISLPFEYAVVTSGVLILTSGESLSRKIIAGARLNCTNLRQQTCWALAMTDAELFWVGSPLPSRD